MIRWIQQGTARSAQAFPPPAGLSSSLSAQCLIHDSLATRNLGSPSRDDQPIPGPCRRHEQERPLPVFVVGQAAGSSASEATCNGMVLGLIPANSITGNSNPLTRCIVAKRMPLSGFSASVEDLMRDAEILDQRPVFVTDKGIVRATRQISSDFVP